MHLVVRDVNNGGGYECVGEREYMEISVHSLRLCCEPKPVLKNGVLIFF